MNKSIKALRGFLSLLLILTATDLICQALYLYYTADRSQIYTVENIKERFFYVWPLLLITIFLVVLNAFLSRKEKFSSVKLLAPPVIPPGKKDAFIKKLLLTTAILLIIHGILNGGMTNVLIKAISICTECIGLG